MAQHLYNFKTGLPVVDVTAMEEAAIADQLMVCNFSSSAFTNVMMMTSPVDYPCGSDYTSDYPSPVDYTSGGNGSDEGPQLMYSDAEVDSVFVGDALPWDTCDRLLVFQHGPYIEYINGFLSPVLALFTMYINGFLSPVLFTMYINGFLSPVLALFTIVSNALTCAVLLQKNMRTPTNVLLVSLAISDALTGLVPLPAFIRFYTTGSYRSALVPTAWCHVYSATTLHLPTVSHTTSIWLTVTLAVQRYIYVGYPSHAKRICTVKNAIRAVIGVYVTVKNAIRAVIGVYVAAFVSQITCFFQFDYTPVDVVVPGDVEPMSTCSLRMAPFLMDNDETYFRVYWYMRVLFINLVPCVLLVAINFRLCLAMHETSVRRRQLLARPISASQRRNPHRRSSECRRLADSNAATMMLLIVVGLFLLVEFPMAVMLMMMIVENQFESVQLMDPEIRQMATVVINLMIMFSYPVNFFIYCGMSQQFCRTFKRIFWCLSNEPMSTTL